ncbi:hypothetical protein DBR32_13960 [Taibaiella sp. KBW10]|nr:hypothetical protein DBR32_13960 [Taibaiella sp. KBW10]
MKDGSVPVFYHKKAKKASKLINDYLQLATVGSLAEPHKDSLTCAYDYVILQNNNRCLSVRCTPIDSTLALPEKSLVFNTATGQVISLTDLFSVNGLGELRKMILRQHADAVEKYIPAESKEEIKKCLKNNLGIFTLKQGIISMQSGACFPANTPYRAVLDIPVQPVENLLSNYGFGVFGLNPDVKMKKMITNSLPNLYTGKIGNDAVLLQLDPVVDKTLSGVLYNVKTGKAIPIQGSFRSNHFEAEGSWGKFSAVISNGIVQGNFRPAGGRPQAINLEK